MKMIKNYFDYLLLVLILMISVGLSSCNDDEENIGSSKDLIGTWQCIRSQGYEKVAGEPDENNEWDDSYTDGYKLVLQDDNTFKEDNREKGIWKLTGNKLVLSYKTSIPEEDWDDTYKILELTSEKLVMEYSYTDDYEVFYSKETLKKLSD